MPPNDGRPDPGPQRRVGLVPSRRLPGRPEQLGGVLRLGRGRRLPGIRCRRRLGRLATPPAGGRCGRLRRWGVARRETRRPIPRRRRCRGGLDRGSVALVGVVDDGGRVRRRLVRRGRRRNRLVGLVRVAARQPVGGAAGEPTRCGAPGRGLRGAVIGRFGRTRGQERRGLRLLTVGVARPRRRVRPRARRIAARRQGRRRIGARVTRLELPWRQRLADRLLDGRGLRLGVQLRGARRRRLATRPVLERRADRECRREAVRLLVREGARRRPRLGEAAVAVVGRLSPPVAIVLERDEWTRGGAVDDREPAVGHRRE